MKNIQDNNCKSSVTKERFVTYLEGVGDHHDFDRMEDAMADAERRGCSCVDQYLFSGYGKTSIVSWYRNPQGGWAPEGAAPVRRGGLLQAWERFAGKGLQMFSTCTRLAS